MELCGIISIVLALIVFILLIAVIALIKSHKKLKSKIFDHNPIGKKPEKIEDRHFKERITIIKNKTH